MLVQPYACVYYCELYWNCQQLVITSLIHCGSLQRWWKFNVRSIVSNDSLFSGLGIGLGTAGLDYNTASLWLPINGPYSAAWRNEAVLLHPLSSSCFHQSPPGCSAPSCAIFISTQRCCSFSGWMMNQVRHNRFQQNYSKVLLAVGNESEPKIIINDTMNLFF